MKVLAFCSRKGGTGKTTLSYNTLERAGAAGLKVAVVDFDPQRGSLRLLQLRRDGGLGRMWDGCQALVNAEGADELQRLREQEAYDLMVCDLPGSDSVALLRVLRQADLVASPVGPAFMDLVSGRDLAADLEVGGLSAWFVGNSLPPHSSWERDFRDDLASMGLAGCPVALRRRAVFMRSVMRGLGVCELEPRSEAAREVDDLWRWLAGQLELPAGAPVGPARPALAGPGQLAGLEPVQDTEEVDYDYGQG